MPTLTIELDSELLAHLGIEARRRGVSPQEVIESLLRQELRVPPTSSFSLATPEPDPIAHLSVPELIALLETSDVERRERARDQLLALGAEIVPELEEALGHPNTTRALAAAELLAKSGASAAILPLLIAYSSASERLRRALYHELKVLLGRYTLLSDSAWAAIDSCTPRTAPLVSRQIKETQRRFIGPRDTLDAAALLAMPDPADILSLIALLRWQRTGGTAQKVAYALTMIALSTPSVELRQALPFLRASARRPFAPPEFAQAVKTIEDATAQWKDLPRPAASDDDEPLDADLPRPVSPPDV
jgi:hypothetical protein